MVITNGAGGCVHNGAPYLVDAESRLPAILDPDEAAAYQAE